LFPHGGSQLKYFYYEYRSGSCTEPHPGFIVHRPSVRHHNLAISLVDHRSGAEPFHIFGSSYFFYFLRLEPEPTLRSSLLSITVPVKCLCQIINYGPWETERPLLLIQFLVTIRDTVQDTQTYVVWIGNMLYTDKESRGCVYVCWKRYVNLTPNYLHHIWSAVCLKVYDHLIYK
jgi:hypothetical protein